MTFVRIDQLFFLFNLIHLYIILILFLLVSDQNVVFYDCNLRYTYTLFCIGSYDVLDYWQINNLCTRKLNIRTTASFCIIVYQLLQSIQEGCCMLVAIVGKNLWTFMFFYFILFFLDMAGTCGICWVIEINNEYFHLIIQQHIFKE